MKKGKIIDITDYFEEGDESKKPKYIPQITNAKRAIPISRIKKIDLFLICPSIAIVSNNFRKYN